MASIGNTVFFSIKALYKRIIDIENKINDIIPTSDITDINQEIDHIQNNIDEMVIEQVNFKKTFTNMQSNVNKLSTDIDTIKETQINTNNDMSSHKFYIEDIENDIVSINTKLNNLDSNISRIDLTFDNVNKDFKMLESLQNGQQDSLVELATNHVTLNQTITTLQDTQHTDKLEVLYKIDDIKSDQSQVNASMVNLETLVNSFDRRIQQSEEIANYCKERVQYCEDRVKYCEELCTDTNNRMILFNNATTALTNQMTVVNDTLIKNTNMSLQTREEIRDFRDAYDLLKKQLDVALLSAQRGDLIEYVVYNRVSQGQLDVLISMYPEMIQYEIFTRYDYSGLNFYGRFNFINFRHAVFENLASISPETRFYNSNMQKCKFKDNDLTGVAFVNCDLGSSKFINCTFKLGTFNGCNVNDATFTNCDLSECVLADTDFSSAIVTDTIFPTFPDEEEPPIYPEEGQSARPRLMDN